jgi:hypothetical protein
VRFSVHGVINHVLLKQRGFGLAKPKLTLAIGALYSHSLTWLPKVTKRIGLSMKLNPQVWFEGGPNRGIVV